MDHPVYDNNLLLLSANRITLLAKRKVSLGQKTEECWCSDFAADQCMRALQKSRYNWLEAPCFEWCLLQRKHVVAWAQLSSPSRGWSSSLKLKLSFIQTAKTWTTFRDDSPSIREATLGNCIAKEDISVMCLKWSGLTAFHCSCS